MYSNIITPKIEERFKASFQPWIPKSKKKNKPCRIKINGEFIRTWGGKSIWAAKGHAKSALRNALGHNFEKLLCQELNIPYDFIYPNYNGYRGETLDRYYKEFLDKAQEEGYIEFVEVDE